MTRRAKNLPRGRAADGRSTRWDHHREARRAELVAATVTAIDESSREASIDEIAKFAGVSKPVLYRYFSDKADLHAAVGRWGAALVLERLGPALDSEAPLKERVSQAVSAYFEVVEAHPQIFLLLAEQRGTGADASGKAVVATTIAQVMGTAMQGRGIDTRGAEPWAHAVVGLGLSTAEWWLSDGGMSRVEVSAYLTEFLWGALVGISRNQGVTIPAQR